MTEKPDFVFPLLCFTRVRWPYRIADEFELSLGGRRPMVDQKQTGMEMIEPDGRSWQVTAVRHVGYAPFKWRYHSFFARPLRLVERTYEHGPTLSVDDVRARVLAHVDAEPGVFCHFSDDAEELEAVKAEVRSLPSIAAIYEWLRPSCFDR